ncbi:MAG: DUF1638 domain-containing protein [Actinomycetes bacterium]
MRSAGATVGIIACGALATDIKGIVARRAWPVDVHPLPPLLHNHPDRIAPQVERTLVEIRERYERVAIAYADCGTYGALDSVCERYGIERLPGSDCYSVYAGVDEYRAILEQEPGTYLLTDYLAASFHRSVIIELGLDRYPDLRDDYFRHYTRVVWLTQRRTPLLQQAAEDAAASIDLPLEIVDVGIQGLEAALEPLVQQPV